MSDTQKAMRDALDLAPFEELAATLYRRYPMVAVIVQDHQRPDGKFNEQWGFQGQYNVLIGLLATLQVAIMTRKQSETHEA